MLSTMIMPILYDGLFSWVDIKSFIFLFTVGLFTQLRIELRLWVNCMLGM